MKQGLLKKSAYLFAFLIAFALVLSPEEEAKAFEIKYDSNMSCVDNAVAPLDNLFDSFMHTEIFLIDKLSFYICSKS